MAKFAIAKQRHQDGITENQVIITSYVHYFGMDFDHTQLPVEDICQVYCLLWSVRLIPTLGTSPLNSDESIAEISSNKKIPNAFEWQLQQSDHRSNFCSGERKLLQGG